MIPILYQATENEYLTNGLGGLSEAVSCVVTEERNGSYELEMQYPITGKRFLDIAEERIILATPSDGTRPQPFRIYRITKPMNGIVTIYAAHISYDLKRNTVMPYAVEGIQMALSNIPGHCVENCPFTFWTDKNVNGEFKITSPSPVRSILANNEGSILDIFGTGDYEFDRYTVRLWQNRGSNRGVSLRYGKNITDIKSENNTENIYTGIVPYWSNNEITLIGNVIYSEHANDYPYNITIPYDFSGEFQEQPTIDELNAKAEQFMQDYSGWKPESSIDVSFVALWQTEEYKNVAPLQRVNLCDTVDVYYDKLGISTEMKVVKTTYDVLTEQYNSIELGSPNQYKMSGVVDQIVNNVKDDINHTSTALRNAIKNANELLRGGLGGYVVINTNADGKPEELLIMDSESKDTAINVIRLNKNGIGFSTTGYYGEYTTAWTIDGSFVADFITAGNLSANLIKGGVLKLGGEDNVNGQINVYDAGNGLRGYWDNNGISLNQSDGSILKMTPDDGFYRLVGSNKHVYHSLYYVSEVTIEEDGQATIQLPVEFSGKSVKTIAIITKVPNDGVGYTFDGFEVSSSYNANDNTVVVNGKISGTLVYDNYLGLITYVTCGAIIHTTSVKEVGTNHTTSNVLQSTGISTTGYPDYYLKSRGTPSTSNAITNIGTNTVSNLVTSSELGRDTQKIYHTTVTARKTQITISVIALA